MVVHKTRPSFAEEPEGYPQLAPGSSWLHRYPRREGTTARGWKYQDVSPGSGESIDLLPGCEANACAPKLVGEAVQYSKALVHQFGRIVVGCVSYLPRTTGTQDEALFSATTHSTLEFVKSAMLPANLVAWPPNRAIERSPRGRSAGLAFAGCCCQRTDRLPHPMLRCWAGHSLPHSARRCD